MTFSFVIHFEQTEIISPRLLLLTLNFIILTFFCNAFLQYAIHSNKILYFTVKYDNIKTLLGINIKAKLKFHVHFGIIGQKANSKLNALGKIANYMELRKNGVLMNPFFTIQFNYCPAIWMCHSFSLNYKINGFLERCQRKISFF